MRNAQNEEVKRVYADVKIDTHKILMEIAKHTSINEFINDAILLKHSIDNRKEKKK